jgi:hypothetical protein
MTKCLMAATVASFALLAAGQGQTQEQPGPVDPEKKQKLLGDQLSVPFRQFLNTCPAGTEITRPGRTLRTLFRRAVPNQFPDIDPRVQNELGTDINLPMLSAANLSLPRLFGQVYPPETLALPASGEGNFLPLDYRDQSLVLAPGFPQLSAYTTCSSALLGALSANSGLSISPAALTATMQADFSTQARSNLRVSHGQFISPLWEMWQGASMENVNADQGRFYAAIVLWAWHRNNPPTIGANRPTRLLRSFQGTVVHRQLSQDSSFATNGSSTVRIGLPLATFDSSVSGRLASQTDIQVQDVRVFIREGNDALNFVQMPSIDQIVNQIEQTTRVSVTYPVGSAQSLIQSGTSEVLADVSALPASLCTPNFWNVRDSKEGPAASTALSLESADIVGEGASRACRFRFAYRAPADTNNDVTIQPWLVSKEVADGKPLALRLGEMQFEATQGPTLQFYTVDDPTLTSLGGTPPRHRLKLSVSLMLRNGDEYGADEIDVSQLRVDCGAGETLQPFPIAFSGEKKNFGELQLLELTGIGVFAGPWSSSSPSWQDCRLAGEVTYRDRGTRLPLRRQVPTVTINMPRAGEPG